MAIAEGGQDMTKRKLAYQSLGVISTLPSGPLEYLYEED